MPSIIIHFHPQPCVELVDFSEDESDWNNISVASDHVGPIESVSDSSSNQVDINRDWSDIDNFVYEEPVVPPASLDKEELWSDGE